MTFRATDIEMETAGATAYPTTDPMVHAVRRSRNSRRRAAISSRFPSGRACAYGNF